MNDDGHETKPLETTGQERQGTEGGADLVASVHRLMAVVEECRDGSPREYEGALDQLGKLYASISEHARALECFQRALRNREERGDTDGIGISLLQIGTAFGSSGDVEAARENLTNALERARSSGNLHLERQALCRIVDVELLSGEFDRAVDIAVTALEACEAAGDFVNAAVMQSVIARKFEQLGKSDVAIGMLRTAVARLNASPEYRVRCSLLLQLARLLVSAGQTELSVTVLEEGERVAHDLGDSRLHADAHELLAAAHEQAGNLRQALEHARQLLRIRERIAEEKRQKEVAVLHVRYQVETIEYERQIYHLLSESQQSQLEARQRELVSQAMHVARRTELLAGFRKDLLRIVQASTDPVSGTKAVNEKPGEFPCEAIDQRRFEAEFHQTHAELRDRLIGHCPPLTKSEARIYSLLRLGLSTTDIADLLCLTERSVASHRFIIRKKLGPSGDQDSRGVLVEI